MPGLAEVAAAKPSAACGDARLEIPGQGGSAGLPGGGLLALCMFKWPLLQAGCQATAAPGNKQKELRCFCDAPLLYYNPALGQPFPTNKQTNKRPAQETEARKSSYLKLPFWSKVALSRPTSESSLVDRYFCSRCFLDFLS